MSKKGCKHQDRQFQDSVGDWTLNLERFYQRQGPEDPQTGCIPWTGVFNNIGYPFMGVRDATTDKYKMVTAHRVALTIKLGRAIAPGMNANHSCHQKHCVAPAHLSEGTQQQKLADMMRDGIKGGRAPGPAGSYDHKQHGRVYRYTEDEIQWIRTATNREISQRYGKSYASAASMKYEFRKGYRWLPMPDK